ncbi:histidine kinase, partial [Streptomyces sp. NPDC056149]
ARTPTVAPPAGLPPREERPQLPTRQSGPAAELPGGGAGSTPADPARPDDAPLGVRRDRGADDDWPLAPREAQDRPRGHEEPEVTDPFRRPAPAAGPGDTAAFPRPDFGGPRPGTTPNDAPATTGPEPVRAPGDTGQFPQPDAHTGQFARPAQDTGQHPRPDADTGQFDTGQFDTGQFDAGQFDAGQLETTGQFPHPESEPTGRAPRPQAGRSPAGEAPLGGDPLRDPLDGAPSDGAGDTRTPIFDTIESNWFNTPAAAAAGVPPLPRRGAPEDGGTPDGASNGGAPVDGARPGTPADANAQWRTSPNDEVWRQAEQVRQPASGGVTTSGLPRRVPRANLVAGTAQQQPPQGGPQVSRAPSDVRGRLTNLRRGIQQGRQAGTSSTGTHGTVDPTHQQER